MVRFALSLLPFALLLALFGCTQGSLPSACAGLPADRMAGCIYESAVLEQNPYSCYSLPADSSRTKCLNDASDSSVKKLLERLTPEERAQLLGIADSESWQPSAILSGASGSEAGQTGANLPKTASPSDSQAYSQAIASNDMYLCASITDASTRASCITQVAVQVKNPDVCIALSLKSDFDLCNLYAKGGEQAK